MTREELLLLCMAYPEISKKYGAVVCIAGITLGGDLRRVYPVPFDKFVKFKFHKKEWISYEVKEKGDYRKESYKIRPDSLEHGSRVLDEEVRVICQANVSTLEDLRRDWEVDKTSVGIIKPILNRIIIKPATIDPRKAEAAMQTTIDGRRIPLDLLKYNIVYKFHCSAPDCSGHTCKCLDTEAGQLYRNLADRWGPDNPEIIPKMKAKFFDWMLTRDLYFVMGTAFSHPGKWMIISIIYLPREPPKIKDLLPPKIKDLFQF